MTLAIILVICSSLAAPVVKGYGNRQEGSQAQPSAPDQTSPQQGSKSQQASPDSGTKPEAPVPCPPSQDTCELAPAPQAPPEGAASRAHEAQATGTSPQQKSDASSSTPVSATKSGKKTKNKQKTTSLGPHKIIVREGGTSEAPKQLAPDMPSNQATHSRQTTERLLAFTRANLERAAARKLNADQQTTVEQIKAFIDQSNAALKAGDLQRGHNLALKARLLSDDLLK